MAPEVISDEAFAYLSVQRGALDRYKADRPAWEAAYRGSLASDFSDMLPFLPAAAASILDIGSGLGGIDVLLHRHYGFPQIVLLDGEAAPARVEQHAKPFSSWAAASRFLEANGVECCDYITTDGGRTERVGEWPVDLVVSLAAWCFHFPPEAYLDVVLELARPGAIVIADVRNDKLDWKELLDLRLKPIGVARIERKFTRRVYAVA